MRRAASIVVGFLLALGSVPSWQGHVHTAPDDQRSGVLHVDHVHFDSSHGSHHPHPDSPPELAAEHSGDDAVTLSFSSTQAVQKRQLPGAVLPAVAGGPPPTMIARSHDPPAVQPPIPPPLGRPPGRAPPA